MMSSPLVSLPDPMTLQLTRRFAAGSMQYWETVAQIMRLVGSSREETERFILQQDACVTEIRAGR
jgi:hypothetical protein